MRKTIGIDLGTTFSVVSFKDTEIKILPNADGEDMTRSCVSLSNDEMLVGSAAYRGMGKDPINTIISIKRLMGGAFKDEMVQAMIKNKEYYKYTITELKGGTEEAVAVVLGGKQYTPEQISSEILKKLKKDAELKLNDEVTHAVITVPAYFTEKQKNATRIAAQLAGLKVQKLLAEPTAAAISFGISSVKTGEAKTVLVYDFGGGTFDLSILNIVDGQYMEAGTGGDRWLGGDDIDSKLQKLVIKKVEKQYNLDDLYALIKKLSMNKRYKFESELKSQIERAKIQLSSARTADIQIYNYIEDYNGEEVDIEVKITREEFEEEIKPLIIRTGELIDQLLSEVGYEISMIDHILLVGGSSSIPLVREILSEKFGSNKVFAAQKPMLAVAEGAGILSHRLGDEYEPPVGSEPQIEDISYSTNHNYYIEIEEENGEKRLETIIEKQIPLPAEINKIFKTTVPNQKIVHVKLFTDIENGAYSELTQGFFTIDGDFPAKSEIVFNISLDINEVFNIKVHFKSNKDGQKEILLGRGNKDSKALSFIAESLDKVIHSDYSSSQKKHFFNSVQKELERANDLGIDNPDSSSWSEIGTNVFTALDNVDKLEQSIDEDEYTVLFANILVNEFSRLLGSKTVNSINHLLQKIEAAEDGFEKSQIVSELKEITEDYPVLITLYTVKIAAHNAESTNPSDANKLMQMYDKIIEYFLNGKSEEAFDLLDEALDLRETYFVGFSGGTGIGK